MLLLRLMTGGTVVSHGITVLLRAPPFAAAALHCLLIVLGVLLLAGLWTPIAGALVAVAAVWEIVSYAAARPQSAATAVMAMALTLLGPGAWSIDAWLYGWKEIKISARRAQDSPDQHSPD